MKLERIKNKNNYPKQQMYFQVHVINMSMFNMFKFRVSKLNLLLKY